MLLGTSDKIGKRYEEYGNQQFKYYQFLFQLTIKFLFQLSSL